MAKQDTRSRIMEAAVALFAKYGFKKTTVDDIAKESGIGKGTVYLYFTGKDEIAIDVMREQNSQIHDRLKSIASGKATPQAKLTQMLVVRVMERFDRIQNYVDSIDDFMGRAKAAYDELRIRMGREESEIFASVLIEGRLLGTMKVEDPIFTAIAMIAATNGLMPTVLSRTELGNRSEVEATAKKIAELLLSGVIVKPN